MTQNIVARDFQGVKIILDGNTKFINLTAPSNAVPISLHDVLTGANYQVPVGKKFTIIFFTLLDKAVSSEFASTTAADASTGQDNIVGAVAFGATNVVFLSEEIVAGRFLTQLTTAFTSAVALVGIEEDA